MCFWLHVSLADAKVCKGLKKPMPDPRTGPQWPETHACTPSCAKHGAPPYQMSTLIKLLRNGDSEVAVRHINFILFI